MIPYQYSCSSCSLHWLLTHLNCHFVAVIYGKCANVNINISLSRPPTINSCPYFAAPRDLFMSTHTAHPQPHSQSPSAPQTETETEIYGYAIAKAKCFIEEVCPLALAAINGRDRKMRWRGKMQAVKYETLAFSRWLVPLNFELWSATVV